MLSVNVGCLYSYRILLASQPQGGQEESAGDSLLKPARVWGRKQAEAATGGH